MPVGRVSLVMAGSMERDRDVEQTLAGGCDTSTPFIDWKTERYINERWV